MASSDPNGPYAAYNAVYNFVNPSGGAGALDVEADEKAQAYVLDKFDSGMVLLKADATGTYKEIHTIKTTDAVGNAVYSTYNCN